MNSSCGLSEVFKQDTDDDDVCHEKVKYIIFSGAALLVVFMGIIMVLSMALCCMAKKLRNKKESGIHQHTVTEAKEGAIKGTMGEGITQIDMDYITEQNPNYEPSEETQIPQYSVVKKNIAKNTIEPGVYNKLVHTSDPRPPLSPTNQLRTEGGSCFKLENRGGSPSFPLPPPILTDTPEIVVLSKSPVKGKKEDDVVYYNDMSVLQNNI